MSEIKSLLKYEFSVSPSEFEFQEELSVLHYLSSQLWSWTVGFNASLCVSLNLLVENILRIRFECFWCTSYIYWPPYSYEWYFIGNIWNLGLFSPFHHVFLFHRAYFLFLTTVVLKPSSDIFVSFRCLNLTCFHY